MSPPSSSPATSFPVLSTRADSTIRLSTLAALLFLSVSLLSVPSAALAAPVEARAEVRAEVQLGVSAEAEPGRGWAAPSPGEMLRRFDPPPEPWSAGHRGVDWAAPGGTVTAPGPGTVSFIGEVAGRPVVSLEHPGELTSSLEPVAAVGHLSVGDTVSAGDVLGRVDGAHCTQACVHWGVRIPDGWSVGGGTWDRYLDPLVLLGLSGPSVLWPLEGEPAR